MRIPLYAAGRVLTTFIPRNPTQWVIGCGVGIGDGALELWEYAHQQGEDPLWLISSPREAADAARRGIRFAYKHSLRGLWATARAGVIVVTHGFGDVNRYTVSGGFLVQLWHGIPLKRIGVDSPETLRSGILPRSQAVKALLRFMYLSATHRIRLFPAASHLVRGRLQSAFGIPDAAVPVTGEPRVDVLSRATAAERRERARAEISELTNSDAGARFVLYAPTWRDGAPDPAVPTAAEWQKIIAALDEQDAVLFVRSHPLGAGAYAPPVPSARVRALGADVILNVTPVLPAFDVLVTDYSSLIFDSALVPLPVVYFAPDFDEYQSRRGFYGTYGDVTGEYGWATDWAGVLHDLQAVLSTEHEAAGRSAHARALSERVHTYRDGKNTQRVYSAISKLSGAHNPHRAPKGKA
nr:CDP-glycerol glycerophosphotransferase family protein [Microbacterium endophyticum]